MAHAGMSEEIGIINSCSLLTWLVGQESTMRLSNKQKNCYHLLKAGY